MIGFPVVTCQVYSFCIYPIKCISFVASYECVDWLWLQTVGLYGTVNSYLISPLNELIIRMSFLTCAFKLALNWHLFAFHLMDRFELSICDVPSRMYSHKTINDAISQLNLPPPADSACLCMYDCSKDHQDGVLFVQGQ